MTDTELNTARAPGCFGTITVYSGDSTFCQKCPSFGPCGEESRKTLEEIRTKLDVDAILAKHRKVRAKALAEARAARAQEEEAAAAEAERKNPPKLKDPEAVAASTKVAADGSVGLVVGKGAKRVTLQILPIPAEKLRAELLAGRNPLAGHPQFAFVGVACQLLLEGGFTRITLGKRLAAEGQSSSASRRQLAISLLTGADIVEENTGMYALKR